MAANPRNVATDSIDDLGLPISYFRNANGQSIGCRPLRGTVHYLLGITSHQSEWFTVTEPRE